MFENLPKNDYPVLNSFLFVSGWIGWVMDTSLVSIRDLFFRLNFRNIDLNISTFSQVNKQKNPEAFEKILNKGL